MEFPIKQNHFTSRHTDDDRALAYRFAAKVARELDKLARAIVLFGSASGHHDDEHPQSHIHTHVGDIDIMIVVDDVTIQLTPEVSTAYRLIVEQAVRDVSPRLHITTVQFTSFWEYMRVADPVMINVLRTGEPLLDTGFFEPMQHLLREGRIRPTTEAIWAYYLRAPATLQNSQWHIMQAAVDLYWACMDAAHAALMAGGHTPPSPKEAGNMLRAVYVEKGLLEAEFAQTMDHFYALSKDITNRRVSTMSAEYYDDLYARAKAFVDRMKTFLPDETPQL